MDSKKYNVSCKALKSLENTSVTINTLRDNKVVDTRVFGGINIDLAIILTDKKHSVYSICNMDENKYTELPEVVKVDPGANNIKGAFSHCYTLTSLDVSHMDVSNIMDMSELFYTCSGLTTIDLSTWETHYVRNFSSMFSYCSNLENIVGVIDMACSTSALNAHKMFGNCPKLKTVKIKNPPPDMMEQKMFPDNNKTPKYGYEYMGLKEGQFEIIE